MRLALVCFYCLCVLVYVLYFIATMSFAGYFLSVLFCMLSMLISDSRFDLVWFRLSCDHGWIRSGSVNVRKQQQQQQHRSTPVAQSAPRNLLTRWDVSSIPANGIFLTKNEKTKIKMPNGWRTINSLVHKIRLHGRRGKGMAESFSRQKSRHAPQKEGGLKILCDLPPV